MKKYKHIYFDLDHTLWDFEKNSRETISELYFSFNIKALGVNSFGSFFEVYSEVNFFMWEQFRLNLIAKETLRYNRFLYTFHKFGIEISEKVARDLADAYTSISPLKKNLFPNALVTLEHLSKNYTLSIITNGFPDVQRLKMKSSGIDSFFSHVFISDELGFKKPEREIFEHAMKFSNGAKDSSVMVGDNVETDIIGALESGMDAVWFNSIGAKHDRKPTHEITSLENLMNFL